MEADFSGWVTKAGLKCSDGRTIMPDAFKHQDQTQVPLVWQHGHKDPENVLGHMLLENRKEGVYGYGFLNKSQKAKHAGELLEHKDIDSMSIWANDLIERSGAVLHGAIREVSLVLSGANPGAKIQAVTIRHGDYDEELEDEAIITTGLELEHESPEGEVVGDEKKDKKDTHTIVIEHADGDPTIEEVYNSMTDDQKKVCDFLVGEALASAGAEHSDIDDILGDNPESQDVYDSMSDKQREFFHGLLDEALNKSGDDDKKGDAVHSNVFDKGKEDKTPKHVISHDDMQSIMQEAKSPGNTLKSALEGYAISHGIEDIDVLFPDAKALFTTPEFFARRTEWVNNLLNAVRKTPFAKVKTVSADLTPAEARAKGYVKGNLKKEEFFKVAKRSTGPTTIYKKQKLDRDDIIDITDFDVVVWMKGEMRVMLDEEIARAILVGDGRAVDDEDKVDEEAIRPVASDHELYTTTVNVEFDMTTPGARNAAAQNFIDEITLNRQYLRGTGQPTLYTTERYIASLLLLKDGVGRKVYRNLDEVASDLRVKEIVSVEVLEEYADIIGILFNPADYNIGANQGGQVALFDDFDIDYNQYKYLMETRISGALIRLKSAMVVRLQPTASSVVAPAAPAFDGTNITVVDQAGVVYRNAATDAVMNAAGSPYVVPDGTTVTVRAEPAAGYYFETSNDDEWDFVNPV